MVRPPLDSAMGYGLKKGPWDPEEDQKLRDYIQQHGHGSWRSLPKRAGLNRCGKSCRLRWINYLRPDIKRGDFSLQEQRTIIHLHSTLGNKWASIATHLPGRTDNEIKNYWNTHLSKKLVRDGIDPKTHQLITNFSNYLPNLSNFPMTYLGNQLSNIRLLENIIRFLTSNPLPPFLFGPETLNQFDATSHGTLNPLTMVAEPLSGDYQSASSTSRPPEIRQHSKDTTFCLPGLIPATPEISSSSKGQSGAHDYSPSVQNYEQVFASMNYGSSWEGEVDDEAFWKDIFCESFPSSFV